jgi:tRNA 2-thiouridine synthesizing protein A
MPNFNRGESEFIAGQDPIPPAQAPSPAAKPAPATDPSGTRVMQEIDARGISPPLPLLRAHRALRALQPGQAIRVITNYPQSVQEFQSLVNHVTGYELLAQDLVGEEVVHVVRRRR